MGTHTGVAGADTPASEAQGHLTGYGTKQYRSYVLNALLFVYILNFLDPRSTSMTPCRAAQRQQAWRPSR